MHIWSCVKKNQLYTEIIAENYTGSRVGIQPTISDLTDQLSSFYYQSNLESNIHQPYKSLKKLLKCLSNSKFKENLLHKMSIAENYVLVPEQRSSLTSRSCITLVL